MRKAIVISTVASVMQQPSFESIVIDEVLYGMIISIQETLSGGWLKIITDYQYEGYVYIENLLLNAQLIDVWEDKDKMVVNINNSDVLSLPKFQSVIITSLTRGCTVGKIDDIGNGFTKVYLPNGNVGFIRTKHIDNETIEFDYKSENDFRESIVNTSKKYLGTQYRWGGKTPYGIDCSGLSFMSYMLNGVVIYRDAQIKQHFPIKEISFKDLKKADLLFFPGHVGIYIGNGKFIHSSSANDGVFINSFNQKDKDCFSEELQKTLYAVGSIF